MPLKRNVATRLSVIIPWCNRPELRISLLENAPVFQRAHSEVIVVNCGGDVKSSRQLLREVRIRGLKLVHIPHSHFNKSLALNAGFLVSREKIVQFLDADIILDKNYFDEALHCLPMKAYVILARLSERSSESRARDKLGIDEIAQTITIVRSDRTAHVETNRLRYEDGSRSAPGIVMFPRRSFMCVDGMNSDLEGWGFEDIDFLIRLQLGTGLQPSQAGRGYHIPHDDKLRFFRGKTPQHNESINSAKCLFNYRNGHFMGTYRDDIKALRTLMTMSCD